MANEEMTKTWTATVTFDESAPGSGPSRVPSLDITVVSGREPDLSPAVTVNYSGRPTPFPIVLTEASRDVAAAASSNPAVSVSLSTPENPSPPLTTTIREPTTIPATTVSPSRETQLPVTVTATPIGDPCPATTAISKASPNVSSGVLAGIGIAGAVVGAVLATFVLCFLVVRRRTATKSESTNGSRRLQSEKMSLSNVRMPLVRRSARPAAKTAGFIEAPILPPLQDSEIGAGLLSFGTSIANHVHSFFNDTWATGSIDVNQDYLAQLLGPHTPRSVEEITFLLVEPSTRATAVRFLLAWCILQHIQTGDDPCRSLLPPEVAESLESMHARIREDKSKLAATFNLTCSMLMVHRLSRNALSLAPIDRPPHVTDLQCYHHDTRRSEAAKY